MRIYVCNPTYCSNFAGTETPSPLYLNSKVNANLAVYNTTGSQFNNGRIDTPTQYDVLQCTDTVATIQGLINDFDTGVSFPATVVTLNGATPSNTAVKLKSQNIIYMWAAPSSNSNVLYWDEILQIIQSYVLSGTPSSIATAINAIAGGDTLGYPNIYTNTENITAHAGGGQQTSGASLLTTEINVIGTVATVLDSVTIGAAAVPGQKMYVTNLGAKTAVVYPFTSGTINGGSANAGVNILPGQTILFEATSTANWQANVTSTQQVITSGATATVNDATDLVVLDLASLAATFALTLPVTPTSGKLIKIVVGGTIATGSPVVTAFTLTPTSAWTIMGTIPTSLNAGDVITLIPVVSNTKYYIQNEPLLVS